MLEFCKNWIFWQKFDFSNSVLLGLRNVKYSRLPIKRPFIINAPSEHNIIKARAFIR